jgi:hypothetical protein
MAEALEYSDIRLAKAVVKLGRIATANVTDFYEPDGRLKDITTLPDRLAEAVREGEFGVDGRPRRIKLHDKLGALTVLLKHLGGLPDERHVEVNSDTQVNVITDEQLIEPVRTRT